MIKFILSYDGTHYFGWQKTKMGPSIQETLEGALAKITGEKPAIEAASRTDRGVHAEGQVVACPLQKEWDLNRLQRALNAVLPSDIRVLEAMPMADDFHPTLHAKGKEYLYRLCLGAVQDPAYRLYSWHFHQPLDESLMERTAKGLLGVGNFSAFANGFAKNPVCELFSMAVRSLPDQRLEISLSGNRFLYKMARNLVGTLVTIGCGKIPYDSLPAILKSRSRREAGVTAPAHGLFLHRVEY